MTENIEERTRTIESDDTAKVILEKSVRVGDRFKTKLKEGGEGNSKLVIEVKYKGRYTVKTAWESEGGLVLELIYFIDNKGRVCMKSRLVSPFREPELVDEYIEKLKSSRLTRIN